MYMSLNGLNAPNKIQISLGQNFKKSPMCSSHEIHIKIYSKTTKTEGNIYYANTNPKSRCN